MKALWCWMFHQKWRYTNRYTGWIRTIDQHACTKCDVEKYSYYPPNIK